MLDLFTEATLAPAQAALVGAAAGVLLCAAGAWLLIKRHRLIARDETLKLRRSLRHAQMQLDQSRKSAEALAYELHEWRRRSAQRQPREAGSSRFAAGAPKAPEAWVIGALLEGDDDRAPSGFADTQILPVTH